MRTIEITPNPSMMDEEIQIVIKNLYSGQHITVYSQVQERKTLFRSHAHFIADLNGVVNLASDNSFGGCYTGVSPMGILWSLQPVNEKGGFKPARYLPRKVMDPQEFVLRVYDGHLNMKEIDRYHKEGKLLAEDTVLRKFCSDGIMRHEVNHGRLRGVIFKPKGPGPFKGVIDMYGGNGGIVEFRAALLASHGFVAYTLPYFKYKDLPEDIPDVEIEYFIEAIQYFQTLDYVHPGISLIGLSFGGGLIVFLSTMANLGITGVVPIGAPHYIQFPMKWKGGFYPDPQKCDLTDFDGCDFEPDEYGGIYGASLIYGESCDHYTTPIEKCSKSTKYLFIVGLQDGNIDAKRSFEVLNQRMIKHNKENQVIALVYPKTGHFVDPPHMPQTVFGLYFAQYDTIFRCGGTLQENNAACRHSWKAMLQFLNRNTGSSSKL
eukprot:TCONS_00020562-protein